LQLAHARSLLLLPIDAFLFQLLLRVIFPFLVLHAALVFELQQVVLAIRNTFLRCTTTMATKTSVGADPDLSGDYRQLVSTLDGQLRAVMERITDLTDMELGFPHWQAKRRHEEALRLEAAAEVGVLMPSFAVSKRNLMEEMFDFYFFFLAYSFVFFCFSVFCLSFSLQHMMRQEGKYTYLLPPLHFFCVHPFSLQRFISVFSLPSHAPQARAELAGALPSSGLEQSSLSLAPSTNAQPRGGGGSGR
jgi:hypothetical protein